MKTPKKPEKKKSLKKDQVTDSKKLNTKSPEPKVQNAFTDDDEGFDDVPLDELEGFDNFNDFDEEDDY